MSAFVENIKGGKYFIQHCFICRPSDSTVSADAGGSGIEQGLLRLWHGQSDAGNWHNSKVQNHSVMSVKT